MIGYRIRPENNTDAPSANGMARVFGDFYTGSHRMNIPACTGENCHHGTTRGNVSAYCPRMDLFTDYLEDNE